MQVVCWLLLLSAAYPLWRAWQSNRRTSLIQAIHWAIIAWAGWGAAMVMGSRTSLAAAVIGSYVALSLTGCAGIAVLGARRPGVAAWNFVVIALLAVDLLPLAQGFATGKPVHPENVHLICVAATIAVAFLNFLPTRLAPAAILLLIGCGLIFDALLGTFDADTRRIHVLEIGWLAIAGVPWVAYGSIRSQEPAPSEFDRLWLDYRNRFGLAWGQRLREQFNRSAAHAGWPVVLRWQGLRLFPGASMPSSQTQVQIVATMRALMKRFTREEDVESSPAHADPVETSQPQQKQ